MDPATEAAPAAPALDTESAEWIASLTATGAVRAQALTRLHRLLLRVTFGELRRRNGVAGPELDDLAHQAADDAMVAILAKLSTFRGESRFTTWAYRFAVLEVSSKLGRHYWRNPAVGLDAQDWDRLPDRFGLEPGQQAEGRELIDAVRRAVDETLSERQRRLFVAIVVDGVPLDAVVAALDTNRNAVYKAVFDARRKIRAFLVANGYLDETTAATRTTKGRAT